MKYTYNLIGGSPLRGRQTRRQEQMKSIYASKVLKQVIWRDFTVHFKAAPQRLPTRRILMKLWIIFIKTFWKSMERMQGYISVGLRNVWPGERSFLEPWQKKFRELHSFAAYICENKERYQVDEGYQDDYYPYLKMVAKQEKFVKKYPSFPHRPAT